jgi:hypothetical protein
VNPARGPYTGVFLDEIEENARPFFFISARKGIEANALNEGSI